MKKRIAAVIMAFIMSFVYLPTAFAEEATEEATVYVTISDEGTLAFGKEGKLMAAVPVTVTDIDNDDKLTVNDTLFAAHKMYYQYGEDGYASADGYYGLYITKLWGDSSEAFGYYLNDASCMSLTNEVSDKDRLTAYIYEDKDGYSDKYGYFTTTGSEFSLVLNCCDWYGTETVKNADIFFVENDELVSTEYRTDESGEVTIPIDISNSYIITANKGSLSSPLVPPIFIVGEPANSGDTGEDNPSDGNIYADEGDIDTIIDNLYSDVSDSASFSDWDVINFTLDSRENELFKNELAIWSYVKYAIGAIGDNNPTDYARVLLALTSLGIDGSRLDEYGTFYDSKGNEVKDLVSDIVGLVTSGADYYENVPIYSLLALKCGDYAVDNGVMTALENKVKDILQDNTLAADLTAVAIIALGNCDEAEAALTRLESRKSESGAYCYGDGSQSWDVPNSNSTALVLMALASQGKTGNAVSSDNEKTVIDGLLSFVTEDMLVGYTDNQSANPYAIKDVLPALISYKKVKTSGRAYNPYYFGSPESPESWAETVGLELVCAPTKTVYRVGEKLDISGLVLEAELSDGSFQRVDNRYVTVEGFDTSSAGEKTVILKFDGKSVTYKITVQSSASEDNETIGSVVLRVDDEKGKPIYLGNINIGHEDTPITILKKAGLRVEVKNTSYGEYVFGIEGRNEGDRGAGSGWVIKVDGEFISSSAGDYILSSDNTRVDWVYTTNYGEDVGGGSSADLEEIKELKNQQFIEKVEEAADKTLKRILKNDVFTAWTAIGAYHCGEDVQKYVDSIRQLVIDTKGVLSERKYTEYSKVITSLSVMGIDASEFEGYDLTAPLNDVDRVVSQGVNGAAWALIALDSGNYGTDKLREKYIDFIIDSVNKDGGFGLTKESDVDITAMVLTALSGYTEDERVKEAVNNALNYLSSVQDMGGGFSSGGVRTSESTAQVIIALSALGIDISDERFVKGGNDLLDALAAFEMNGEYLHRAADTKPDAISTEQAFLALMSLIKGGNIYKGNVDYSPFNDVSGSRNEKAINTLYRKGVLSGTGGKNYEPEREMTRAEFITALVIALGIEPLNIKTFDDVDEDDWYYEFIAAAKSAGLIVGNGDGKCAPDEKITGEQAAVIMKKAMDIIGKSYDNNEKAYIVGEVSSWAYAFVNACAESGIFENIDFDANMPVIRAFMAQMVYNLIIAEE